MDATGMDAIDFDALLDRNAAQAAVRSGAAGRPAGHLAVLTCMDTRIDPLAVLGLPLGQAVVLRNAGARVTPDALRSLALASAALGVEALVVMQHTRCGLSGVTQDELARATGADMDFLPITDHDTELNRDLDVLIQTPYLSGVRALLGLVYDVETGRVREVRRWQRD